ncbi:MAG: hypothetical protein JWM04_726 [Verrucomicrobiales bacterium]|jgi:hypothetical protein|nr:hypothetical protein [Verrucomicrobiales bacterium]
MNIKTQSIKSQVLPGKCPNPVLKMSFLEKRQGHKPRELPMNHEMRQNRSRPRRAEGIPRMALSAKRKRTREGEPRLEPCPPNSKSSPPNLQVWFAEEACTMGLSPRLSSQALAKEDGAARKRKRPVIRSFTRRMKSTEVEPRQIAS